MNDFTRLFSNGSEVSTVHRIFTSVLLIAGHFFGTNEGLISDATKGMSFVFISCSAYEIAEYISKVPSPSVGGGSFGGTPQVYEGTLVIIYSVKISFSRRQRRKSALVGSIGVGRRPVLGTCGF